MSLPCCRWGGVGHQYRAGAPGDLAGMSDAELSELPRRAGDEVTRGLQEGRTIFQMFALTVVIIIVVAALMLFVVLVTRAALDELDRRDEQRRKRWEERPSVPEKPDAWRQWATYYRGLAELARAEGNAGSATTYDSLAETYSALGDDAS